jgi:hypothetical protein
MATPQSGGGSFPALVEGFSGVELYGEFLLVREPRVAPRDCDARLQHELVGEQLDDGRDRGIQDALRQSFS